MTLSLPLHLFPIYLSVYLPSLNFCKSCNVYLSIDPVSLHLSVYLSIYSHSIYLSTPPFICLSIMSLSICPTSPYLSVYLSLPSFYSSMNYLFYLYIDPVPFHLTSNASACLSTHYFSIYSNICLSILSFPICLNPPPFVRLSVCLPAPRCRREEQEKNRCLGASCRLPGKKLRSSCNLKFMGRIAWR